LPGITRNPRPNRSCFLSKDLCCYCFAPPLEPVEGVVLLPPMPELEPLDDPGVVGAVGLVVLEPLELPMPEEPLPALEPLR
jgi:hypothetical protein